MPDTDTDVRHSESPAAPESIETGFLARRDLWAMALGAIAVLLLYVYLSNRDAATGDAAKSAQPLSAVLVVVSAEVLPAKANGKSWDLMNGPPDPRVTVSNRTTEQKRQTREVADTLAPTFNARMVRVREGDQIYVRVDDADIQLDDVIGEHRFDVTRELIEKGEIDLSFGQVKRLKVRFAKAD